MRARISSTVSRSSSASGNKHPDVKVGKLLQRLPVVVESIHHHRDLDVAQHIACPQEARNRFIEHQSIGA